MAKVPKDDHHGRLHELLEEIKKHGNFPEGCAEVASLYEKFQQWRDAATWWTNARGASIGRQRASRYAAAAERCLEKAYDVGEREAGGSIRMTRNGMILSTPTRIWEETYFGTVDPHGVDVGDGVISEVNNILRDLGHTYRFQVVDCGDDNFYFAYTDSNAEAIRSRDKKGRIIWAKTKTKLRT